MKTDAIDEAILEATQRAVRRGFDADVFDEARAQLDALKAELARLRALLASGKCVDLARVTDAEVGTKVLHSWRDCCATPEAFDEELRSMLVEKPGVKA